MLQLAAACRGLLQPDAACCGLMRPDAAGSPNNFMLLSTMLLLQDKKEKDREREKEKEAGSNSKHPCLLSEQTVGTLLRSNMA